MNKFAALAGAAALALGTTVAYAADGPTDPQIAHIAYTAGALDVANGQQALAKSHNKAVRAFAQEMVRDHKAVNDQALALVKKLHVTPADNATSQAITKAQDAKRAAMAKLNGAAYDRAYAANEVAYHETVNKALKSTLIPSADNPQLKSLLETGLTLFTEHLNHAKHLAASLK